MFFLIAVLRPLTKWLWVRRLRRKYAVVYENVAQRFGLSARPIRGLLKLSLARYYTGEVNGQQIHLLLYCGDLRSFAQYAAPRLVGVATEIPEDVLVIPKVPLEPWFDASTNSVSIVTPRLVSAGANAAARLPTVEDVQVSRSYEVDDGVRGALGRVAAGRAWIARGRVSVSLPVSKFETDSDYHELVEDAVELARWANSVGQSAGSRARY